MAKIRKNIQEKGLDVKSLYRKYSSLNKEDEKLKNIFNFVKECEIEVKEIMKIQREEIRKREALQGLYLEIYNFVEEETPKIYRACYKNEVLSFGTDFGKNYHNLLLKRKELVKENSGKIKLNGIEIKQTVPEINIIEVGV